MQKAIHLDTNGTIRRVLAIAEPEIITANPTGFDYIVIDDYTEPPALADAQMDKAYPMYHTTEQRFFWQVVHYQTTAGAELLQYMNVEEKLKRLEMENVALQEAVDTLLLDALTQEGV